MSLYGPASGCAVSRMKRHKSIRHSTCSNTISFPAGSGGKMGFKLQGLGRSEICQLKESQLL